MGAELAAALAIGITSAVASATSAGLSYAQNQQNLSFQNLQNRYGQIAAIIQMAREDNAVQRRVADLKAAGLSPVLAAGSPAASSAVMSYRAPKSEMDYSQIPNGLNGALQSALSTAISAGNVNKMNEETQKIKQQRELDLLTFPHKLAAIDASAGANLQRAKLNAAQTMSEYLEYKRSKEYGVSKTGSQGGKMVRDFLELLDKPFQEGNSRYGK